MQREFGFSSQTTFIYSYCVASGSVGIRILFFIGILFIREKKNRAIFTTSAPFPLSTFANILKIMKRKMLNINYSLLQNRLLDENAF